VVDTIGNNEIIRDVINMTYWEGVQAIFCGESFFLEKFKTSWSFSKRANKWI